MTSCSHSWLFWLDRRCFLTVCYTLLKSLLDETFLKGIIWPTLHRIMARYLQWTLRWQHQNPHGWCVQSQRGRRFQVCPCPGPSFCLLQVKIKGQFIGHPVHCMWSFLFCMSTLHISHLSQRQTWRWSCFWTSSPPVQTAAAESCDWLTVSPWVLLLGCSSWQGGRGACPHTLRCHTSTHTYTCTDRMRRTNHNAYKKLSKSAATSVTSSLLPVFSYFTMLAKALHVSQKMLLAANQCRETMNSTTN